MPFEREIWLCHVKYALRRVMDYFTVSASERHKRVTMGVDKIYRHPYRHPKNA